MKNTLVKYLDFEVEDPSVNLFTQAPIYEDPEGDFSVYTPESVFVENSAP
jgi:hypothetical protein